MPDDPIAAASSIPQPLESSDSPALAADERLLCVLTRFRLRSIFWLPHFLFAFRSIYKEARSTVPGLVKAVFLIESPRVCYTLSMWRDECSILEFGSLVGSHAMAGNWAIKSIYRNESGRPEIWSTRWALCSPGTNLSWAGIDWHTVLRENQNPRSRGIDA